MKTEESKLKEAIGKRVAELREAAGKKQEKTGGEDGKLR